MSSSPLPSDPEVRREALVVAGLTAAGGMLRIWSVGRLGLVHFDEGIYAMAGTWVLSPSGLGGLDPTVISYAPPGFPFLVGLAYGLLGVGDISAILVSIAGGTLTIPVAGWLAYRTFGRGAGAAASAFVALSAPHIAFSRMALTDASYLLCWLLAISQGQRFLERPGPMQAAALGFCVGVAQLFKYNGWIAGLVVIVGAAVWTPLSKAHRTARFQCALWGWGLFAALIASGVYWPWFRFVESHGGYAALLAHHRGYVGGLSSWPGHAIVQLEQERALSGGVRWLALCGFVAALSMQGAIRGSPDGPRSGPRQMVIALCLTALCSFFHGALFGAMLWLIILARTGVRTLTTAAALLLTGWIILVLLIPFYHPYARLMLPLQALAWILLGGAFASLRQIMERLSDRDQRRLWGVPESLLRLAAVCWLIPLILVLTSRGAAAVPTIGELLGPTDSLRQACGSILGELPKDLGSLRLYARPPVAFYLSGAASVAPQPTLRSLFDTRDPKAWALLDAAMVRQGGGLRGQLTDSADRWDLVREVPTVLNVPTLLDVDPSAATHRTPDRSASLLLFRPKRPGASP